MAATRPSQTAIWTWTIVWIVLLLLAVFAVLPAWELIWWTGVALVGLYLLWLTYRWYQAPRI